MRCINLVSLQGDNLLTACYTRERSWFASEIFVVKTFSSIHVGTFVAIGRSISYCIEASYKEKRTMKSAARAIAVMTSIALLLAVLAACSPSSQSSSSSTTLTVATVNNSNMVQMEQVTKQVFEKDHPNIKVNFVTLPENDLRT